MNQYFACLHCTTSLAMNTHHLHLMPLLPTSPMCLRSLEEAGCVTRDQSSTLIKKVAMLADE